MLVNNLLKLLGQAAVDGPDKGITVYHSGSNGGSPSFLAYGDLLAATKQRSMQLRQLASTEGKVVLMYFADHLDSITWFWSIVASGAVPCICPPLSKDLERRQESVAHLRQLLEEPLIITSKTLASEFVGLDCPRLLLADDVESVQSKLPYQAIKTVDSDLAVLMLTSGSTSNPKAVCLSHGQILAAVRGKSVQHGTSQSDVFLNWIGLDHVANLTDNHLHAVSVAANQVHLQGEELLANPLSFLKHIGNHKVTITFAPNFFLALLVRSLEAMNESEASNPDFELSSLRALLSGGESNVVDTCSKLNNLLWKYGVVKTFLRPGFGMTETCAGCIHNIVDCPSYDVKHGAEFCTLGDANQAVKMRIVRQGGGIEAGANEIGSLQVSGPAVFGGYYNDEKASEAAFTPDGWFKTGDVGYLDSNGRLRLTGREKDSVIINSINYSSESIESAIEQAAIPGVTSSFTAVWAHRQKSAETETLCIVYLPTYPSDDTNTRLTTAAAISRAVVKYCGARPFRVIALPASLLQKSSLGKLSRSKIRQAFEEGAYLEYESEDKVVMETSRKNIGEGFTGTATEKMVLEAFYELLAVESGQLGLDIHIDSDMFELGVSSIDLLKLKSCLQRSLKIEDIPTTIFFSHPVLRYLSQAIDDLRENENGYDPVTVLQPHGTKTPLFLIHPGVGDILIFMNLARFIDGRPVYALRARGFDGEEYFSSMQELITTYHDAIKRVQPTGPYAIGGYSFGANIAFEIAKVMEANKDRVQFLAAIDQPPHFKEWAQTCDWYDAVLTISLFMGLITPEYFSGAGLDIKTKSHEDVLDHILSLADPIRLEEIGLTRARLDNWAKLVYQLKVIGRDYDPAGLVANMDVFHTDPLVVDKTWDWAYEDVCKWTEFAENVQFHKVKGSHISLMTPPNVLGFQELLKRVMKSRGL
ncbi:Microperfuranone synthase [Cladobotryum mycophilum]|uniref:Microperfuranone synthase n=1 Tax=Cladobotryum mycophilum TaxID=491253 RepID=A0ABR0S821_9HYPO